LPWAQTVFGKLEIGLVGTCYGVSPKPLQRYLGEFRYHFHRRWQGGELLALVLRSAVGEQSFPCRVLVAEGAA
jgi:hypothetical protein